MHLIPCLQGDSLTAGILSHSFTPVNINGKLSSIISALRRRNVDETTRSKGKKNVGKGKKKLSEPVYFYSPNIPATVVPERPPNLEIVAGGHV